MAPVVISYEMPRVAEGEERSRITYDLLQSVMIDFDVSTLILCRLSSW